ncbi:hypothetical protein GQ57_20225 [Burkholderia sp. MSh2]|nr:hypothetical protein GQ57_20225 [Burkholderia sp. MSh2]KFG97197.1 hypothetical protein GQ56_0111615 [Burkholderia paludis]
MKRPTSLTILGWLLVVLDVGNLVYLPLLLSNPLAIELLSQYRVRPGVTILVGLIVAVSCIVAGVAILKGREWGRTLYVGASVAGLAISAVTMPTDMTMVVALVPSALLFALFACLLYRRPATEYLRQARS